MLGMDKVGKEFSEGRAAVTNLVISAAAMNAVLKHIKPFLESGEVKRKGTCVIGTVRGDLHDIGKNLVSMIVTGGGFEVIDLRSGCADEQILGTLAQHRLRRRASALLTITMPAWKVSRHQEASRHEDHGRRRSHLTGVWHPHWADFTSHNPHSRGVFEQELWHRISGISGDMPEGSCFKPPQFAGTGEFRDVYLLDKRRGIVPYSDKLIFC
jgi:hypothetical protein